ncbi:MAG: transketolase [Actinomycetota bacterium]
MEKVQEWNELAAQLAIDSIRCSTAAGSGHPTSSMSAAHLLAVLYSDHLRYDVAEPRHPGGDRFVLSKGHASPLMFSTLKAIGAITDEQLLTFRTFGSPVEGHPVPLPDMPWIDVATGSLGQGLPIGLGMALGLRILERPGRVWVLMGDSEVTEGSVWEAMENASYHGLDNLIGILDMNRLGQRGPTMLQWDGEAYARRAEAFGWHARVIDGHDVAAITDAYREAEETVGPSLIVAKTEKGHGVSFLANKEGWHGKVLSAEQATQAIEELGGERAIAITPAKPEQIDSPEPARRTLELPVFDDAIATRRAFGDTLAALASARGDVVALDAEVGNSTYTEEVEQAEPARFAQMFIAEQAMLGASVGLQAVGLTPFAATFGAFLSRAYDFARMAAISRAHIRLCGSHAGVSIGEDGPSQMALEDLASFRAINGSTVLYPADGTSTAALVATMADWDGVAFMRTTREATPKLYADGEAFPIGGSKVHDASADDHATIVGAGITLVEGLAAAELLRAEGTPVRVIDVYSVKPIDGATLREAMEETGLLVVVEDHRTEGGIGDAALEALAEDGRALSGKVVKLAVTKMPMSGSPTELRDWAGISASKIADAVRAKL